MKVYEYSACLCHRLCSMCVSCDPQEIGKSWQEIQAEDDGQVSETVCEDE